MSVEVTLGQVAHGGFVVGRADGKVMFVTGGLPGERVLVDITQHSKNFDRAHVVEVLDAAPGRVESPCSIAAECGGCDWQFANHETQLDLKTAVVSEQLSRLAGITWGSRVEAVPGGLSHWRTRMRFAVNEHGQLGFRERRSHMVVPLPAEGCLIADGVNYREAREVAVAGEEVIVAKAAHDTTYLGPRLAIGDDPVTEIVHGRAFEVAADGFWQVHREAAETLTTAVLAGLKPRSGESALDLYCGVGLFAGALVDAGCDVLGVEAGRRAIDQARRNVPEARFIASPMEKALGRLPRRADVVVLDPPRKGAGAAVVDAVVACEPRAIAYVACDPAALARDLAYFAERGYVASDIRGFDLFPMTQHIECVAILHPRV